jgi:hypothetical protein
MSGYGDFRIIFVSSGNPSTDVSEAPTVYIFLTIQVVVSSRISVNIYQKSALHRTRPYSPYITQYFSGIYHAVLFRHISRSTSPSSCPFHLLLPCSQTLSVQDLLTLQTPQRKSQHCLLSATPPLTLNLPAIGYHWLRPPVLRLRIQTVWLG